MRFANQAQIRTPIKPLSACWIVSRRAKRIIVRMAETAIDAKSALLSRSVTLKTTRKMEQGPTNVLCSKEVMSKNQMT